MELKICALVVTLISSVIANPYGYGVKGGSGASAKAISGASAGTFDGDVPVPVPFGNGFSGSFTKSASSSSSSSSASSSSSSGSFSYSGSGAGGYSNQGLNGNIGCTSGLCRNSGVNQLSTNFGPTGSGSSVQGYNAANAAAVAGSGGNCHGPTCISSSEKCSSGQCLSKPQTTLPSRPDDIEKCTSGQCGIGAETGPSASQYDSDDIHFVGHTSNSALDSKDESSNNHEVAGYSGSFNCRGDNCAKTSTSNSHLDSAQQPTSLTGKQLPATSNYKPGNGYSSPSLHLETPKEDSNCDSGNCNIESSRPSYDNSLSSYNVPIHGIYDSNNQKPQCEDGKCGNPQKGSYSTNGNSLSTNHQNSQDSYSSKGSYSPSSPICSGLNCGSMTSVATNNQFEPQPSNSGSTNCNSPSCNPHYSATGPTGSNVHSNQKPPIYTNGFGAPTGVLTVNPIHTHPSTTLQKIPAYGSASTGCNSPNCFGQTSSPGVHSQPTFSGNNPIAGANLPTYTGGFGGPAGMLKPNEYEIPTPGVSKPIPSVHPTPSIGQTPSVSPTYNTPAPVTTGCKTGNCFGSSNTADASSTSTIQSDSYDTHKESQSGGIYTGGFGGPAGMLKPNEFDMKPGHFTGPSYNIQSPIPSITGCKTPNCNGNAGTVATPQSGLHGDTKPNFAVDSSSEQPPYTDGFGGPAGMLKPNEFDIKPVHSTGPSYNTQSTVPSTTGCKTPNCNGNAVAAGAVTAPTAQSGLYGATKPNIAMYSSSEQPPYTGGFGGPAGLLKPNEFDLPHNAPSHYPSQLGTSLNKAPTNINSAGCSTPNCTPHNVGNTIVTHTQSPFAATKPITPPQLGYTSNYGRPVGVTYPTPIAVSPITLSSPSPFLITGTYSSGCKTPDCSASPTSEVSVDKPLPSPNGVNNIQGGSKPSNSLSDNGLNRPTISINPSVHSHNLPSTVSSSTNCKSSDCTNLDSTIAGSTSQAGSYAGSKQPLPMYTNGFGAPTGLLNPLGDSISAGTLKPNDHAKLPGPAASPACTTGYCNSIPTSPSSPGYNVVPSSSGSLASASSSASANAIAYSGGFGGPPGILLPYDNDKTYVEQNYGKTNINAPPAIKPQTFSTGIPSQTGAHTNLGALAGSTAGAFSGASSNGGSFGYGNHGSGTKTSSPCGGGCGGGYQDGLTGSSSSAAAGAKSLSNAGGFGYGGGFASSSSSAHASGGSYTKGGYGKR